MRQRQVLKEYKLSDIKNYREVAFVVGTVMLLIVAFALSPIPEADDWEVFYGAARRAVQGEELYGVEVRATYYYYNPPWLAIALIPVGLLPIRWGWATVSVLSLIIAMVVVKRWGGGAIKMIIALLSPPVLYVLLHGQIDLLVIGGLLLPKAWWVLVGLIKPQVGIGLIFGLRKKDLWPVVLTTLLVAAVTVVWFGWWPPFLIEQPTPESGHHNVWLGLWPFQAPVGVALAFWGMEKKDERFLLAASPFFMPYAAISSLIGPWLAVVSLLKSGQGAVVLAVWWGAVVYRALGL